MLKLKNKQKVPTSDSQSSTERKTPILKLKSPEPSKGSEELDLEVFYSPTSQKSDSSQTSRHSGISLIEKVEKLTKEEILPIDMAEEGEDFAEEYEAQAEQPQPTFVDATETEGETEEEAEVSNINKNQIKYKIIIIKDEMKEVEKMIKQASAELAEVHEENQQLIQTFTEVSKKIF